MGDICFGKLAHFLQVCPSLLLKKDRGRSVDPKARPKAFGEISVAANVPGVELLEDDDGESGDDDDADGKNEENGELVEDDNNSSEDAGGGTSKSDFDSSDNDDLESDNDGIDSETNSMQEDEEEGSEDDDAHYSSDNTDDVPEKASSSQEGNIEEIMKDNATIERKSKGGKRKFSDFEDQLNAANKSLRALKKLAGSKIEETSVTKEDGILSNADFQRIKELKVGCFILTKEILS